MPALITIPPHYWSGATEIRIRLTDSQGETYPGALNDASGFLGGELVLNVDAAGAIFSLPYNDEIPSPPNQGQASSTWTIRVQAGRTPAYYRSAIHSSSPISTWNELLGAGEQVDAEHVFSSRLLPAGAQVGQFAAKAVDGWEAIDPPAGTGDVVGPAAAVDGNLAVFSGATGKVIRDGGPLAGTGDVVGPPSSTDGHVALFSGATGKVLQDGGPLDHGNLSGLGVDDHPQYHNDARGDARYPQLVHGHVLADISDAGTAAAYDVGVAADDVVQLDGNARIPAVDGSLLTGLSKGQVGLGNVDNTADVDKPVSIAVQAELDAKQDTITSIIAIAGF